MQWIDGDDAKRAGHTIVLGHRDVLADGEGVLVELEDRLLVRTGQAKAHWLPR